ncbi:hypothetical protein [Lacisediminihabitans sp.]|uniref:hypothetical protein n=1 Tax=Lacisediminihabitans sp. TaxID=2787631 RepID=UPI002F9508B3
MSRLMLAVYAVASFAAWLAQSVVGAFGGGYGDPNRLRAQAPPRRRTRARRRTSRR